MRKRYWLRGVKVLALAALLGMCFGESQAQIKKYLPTLSLVKQVGAPGDVTQRDTIYVSEPGPGEKRYLILPIFIKNCLDSLRQVYFDQTTGRNVGIAGEPIYSFSFSLQYNRTILRAIGVSKHGPLPQDSVTLGQDFNYSWDVDQDPNYKVSTAGVPSANGERIKVSASSAIPLPLSPKTNPNLTGCDFRDTTVLTYIIFEVVGDASGGSAGANRDLMILSRDSVRFNEYNPANVSQEMLNRGFDFFQAGVAPTPIFPVVYPNNYGSAVLQITPRPRIDLQPSSQVVRINGNETQYQLITPLQTYYGNGQRIYRNILILNGVPNSYLRDVVVESDAPWLRIDTKDPVLTQPGQGGENGERGIYIRNVGQQLNFNVIANPSLLPTSDGSGYPTPGLYSGYITVRSTEARNSAVRLRVDLLVTRNPFEPSTGSTTESTNPFGIRLLLRNSAVLPDTTYLTFGTGEGATRGVDTLFGESEATSYPNTSRFFARFFPPGLDTINDPNTGARLFRGLLDNRGIVPQSTNGENSLDIRNYKTNTTLVYCVKFSAGAPNNYPIVIEFDTRDFPNGSQLYMRDNLSGQFVSLDLRNATGIGGTKRAVTIRDASVTGFCIEYTLPQITQFPEIKRGWNLVSLPVSPSDARSSTIFPNIISYKPLFFASSLYQPVDTLEVGRGYFVRYGERQDRVIAGTQVRLIHELQSPFRVAVTEGWNTVGGLSVPTTVSLMSFGPFQGSAAPRLISEVYRYVTDRGYEQVSLIIPGFGYWVKINTSGFYRLAAPPNADFGKASAINQPYNVLNRLSISDDAQRVGTLYFGQNSSIDAAHFELPPVPARDLFDVRFGNNGFVSTTSTTSDEHVVRLQGAIYPVVLSVSNPDADYVVTDAATGTVLGSFTRGQAGAVRVTDASVRMVKITAATSASMELGNAFPNPTSGNVAFSFSVPTEQHVSISLVNGLGREVRSLFAGSATGRQTVEFSTEGLAAGVYYYRMTTSTGFTQVRQIVVSK